MNPSDVIIGQIVTYHNTTKKYGKKLLPYTAEITHIYRNDDNEIATCKMKGKDGTIAIENLKIFNGK